MCDLYREKIHRLREVIDKGVRPLIKGDYVLFDAPYYHNIGDVLIWQGIHDFCKTLPGRNLGTSNITTCRFPKLPSNVTILLMGGGNFGDLWRPFQDFRLKVVSQYPENTIIMFPQSVWYENQDLIAKDAQIFNSHMNLHLCARDEYSFKFLKCNFTGCNIHLVPDMAFYIDHKLLDNHQCSRLNAKLFLKRLDKEFDERFGQFFNRDGYDIKDWPTYEKNDSFLWITRRMEGLFYRTQDIWGISGILATITNAIAKFYVRHHLVKKGMQFLEPYSEIVTTRLHTMILGVLLGKKIEYMDNTTGKISAFADCWLSDFDNVKKYEE